MNTVLTQPIECLASKKLGNPLELFEYTPAPLRPWDIEVDITHCGICHSDLHLLDNEWNATKFPFVPGHEIVGHVTQKGDLVERHAVGMKVGIGWQRGSCHHCEWCHSGNENVCEKVEATCVGHHGGFARKIVIDSRFAFKIPKGLSSENAAPLLCGGATVFSPLKDHRVQGTTKVGIIGLGGLGHLALQFAHAFGCEVTAFSSTPSKEEEAHKLGADYFVSTRNEKELKNRARSFDLILHCGSQLLDPSLFLDLLRPYGSLCFLGASSGNMHFQGLSLIGKKTSISGSNIANPLVMEEMLSFSERHGIEAMVEVFSMQEANTAIEKLRSNQVRYRAVLKW
jgi:alcohol/geraniol dehydrogenase (NADP+)